MSIDKRVKYDVQGGVKNYLGKQKEVKAPLKWQSSPDHPTTELAYITQAEKDLLVKQDLHGSLKGGVNRGPSGIMSLNGGGWGWGNDPQGEFGGTTSSGGGWGNDPQGEFGGIDTSSTLGGYDAPTGAVDDPFSGGQKMTRETGGQGTETFYVGQSPDYYTTTNLTGYDEQTGVNTPPRNTGHDGGRDNNDLQTLYNQGVSTINTPFNLPTPLTAGLNVLTPLRNFGLRKNIDYFRNEVLKNKNRGGYTDTLESYKKYMQNRLAGKTDAHGNPMRGFEDGNDGIMNIPLETIGGNLSETIGGNLSDDTEEGEFVSRFLQNQPDDIREEIEARMQNYYTV